MTCGSMGGWRYLRGLGAVSWVIRPSGLRGLPPGARLQHQLPPSRTRRPGRSLAGWTMIEVFDTDERAQEHPEPARQRLPLPGLRSGPWSPTPRRSTRAARRDLAADRGPGRPTARVSAPACARSRPHRAPGSAGPPAGLARHRARPRRLARTSPRTPEPAGQLGAAASRPAGRPAHARPPARVAVLARGLLLNPVPGTG